jgi:hypothetical protein
MRHDILKGNLRRVVHRAGIASTQEPALRRLPGLDEARGDILLALPGDITIVGIPPTP